MEKIMSRIINIVFVLVFGFIILGGLFLKIDYMVLVTN